MQTFTKIMMDNIEIGPLILYNDEEAALVQQYAVLEQDWLPVCVVKSGEMFNWHKKNMENQPPPLLGIIITIGFFKPYEA